MFLNNIGYFRTILEIVALDSAQHGSVIQSLYYMAYDIQVLLSSNQYIYISSMLNLSILNI